jgi:hypothetical protein
MSWVPAVHLGHRPWLPSETSDDLDVVFGYEMPLVGTYVEPDTGQRVLFTCLYGRMDRINVWAYATLNLEEAAEWFSKTFESPEDLTERVFQTLQRRPVVFALAADQELLMANGVSVVDDVQAQVSRFANDAFARVRHLQETQAPTFDPGGLLGVA